MDFVAEINNLITLAADLPKDGAAAAPFRNGLARLKKSLVKEIEAMDARLREMEADSKDSILATQNDLLTQQLQEAHEKCERLERDLLLREKKQKRDKAAEKEYLSGAEQGILRRIDAGGPVSPGDLQGQYSSNRTILEELAGKEYLDRRTSRDGFEESTIYTLGRKAKVWLSRNPAPQATE